MSLYVCACVCMCVYHCMSPLPRYRGNLADFQTQLRITMDVTENETDEESSTEAATRRFSTRVMMLSNLIQGERQANLSFLPGASSKLALDALHALGKEVAESAHEQGLSLAFDNAMVRSRRNSHKKGPQRCRDRFLARARDTRLCWKIPVDHPLRAMLQRVTASALAPAKKRHAWYRTTMDVITIASCVALAMESPVNPGQALFWYLDMVFLVVFSLEITMKCVADGLLFPRANAYLCDGWNWIDLIVTAALIPSVAFPKSQAVESFGATKILRVFRALRPLRMVKNNENMRRVFTAIIRSLPGIFQVMCLNLTVLAVFAILGMELFGGRLWYCTNEQQAFVNAEHVSSLHLPSTVKAAGIGSSSNSSALGNVGHHRTHDVGADTTYHFVNKSGCVSALGKDAWVNADNHFDDFPNAILTMFQMATLEGYVDIMHSCMDITGVDQQPVFDNSWMYCLFFVLYIVFMAFFLIQIFVGVITRQLSGASSESMLTSQQKMWRSTQRIIYFHRPTYVDIPKPDCRCCRGCNAPITAWRRFCHSLVVDCGRSADLCSYPHCKLAHSIHRNFDTMVAVVILLNALVAVSGHSPSTLEYQLYVFNINLGFLAFFILEVILKISGMGLGYLTAGNMFDFFVVLLSAIFQIQAAIEAESNPESLMASADAPALQTARLLRLSRFVIHSAAATKTVRMVISTVMQALPTFINLTLLMLVCLSIFALAGTELFGLVGFNATEVNDPTNFNPTRVWSQQCGNATHPVVHEFTAINAHNNFHTFSAGLVILMRIVTGENWQLVMRDCGVFECHEDNMPGASTIFYFMLFIIVGAYVFLPFYLGVLVEEFNSMFEHRDAVLTPRDFKLFQRVWRQHTPRGTFPMPLRKLEAFMADLAKEERRKKVPKKSFVSSRVLHQASQLGGAYIKRKVCPCAPRRDDRKKGRDDDGSDGSVQRGDDVGDGVKKDKEGGVSFGETDWDGKDGEDGKEGKAAEKERIGAYGDGSTNAGGHKCLAYPPQEATQWFQILRAECIANAVVIPQVDEAREKGCCDIRGMAMSIALTAGVPISVVKAHGDAEGGGGPLKRLAAMFLRRVDARVELAITYPRLLTVLSQARVSSDMLSSSEQLTRSNVRHVRDFRRAREFLSKEQLKDLDTETRRLATFHRAQVHIVKWLATRRARKKVEIRAVLRIQFLWRVKIATRIRNGSVDGRLPRVWGGGVESKESKTGVGRSENGSTTLAVSVKESASEAVFGGDGDEDEQQGEGSEKSQESRGSGGGSGGVSPGGLLAKGNSRSLLTSGTSSPRESTTSARSTSLDPGKDTASALAVQRRSLHVGFVDAPEVRQRNLDQPRSNTSSFNGIGEDCDAGQADIEYGGCGTVGVVDAVDGGDGGGGGGDHCDEEGGRDDLASRNYSNPSMGTVLDPQDLHREYQEAVLQATAGGSGGAGDSEKVEESSVAVQIKDASEADGETWL